MGEALKPWNGYETTQAHGRPHNRIHAPLHPDADVFHIPSPFTISVVALSVNKKPIFDLHFIKPAVEPLRALPTHCLPAL